MAGGHAACRTVQMKPITSRPLDDSASATHENRVAIIGCGKVGMASAFALIQSSFVRELVLVSRDVGKTEGEAMDLQDAVAVPMKSPVRVVAGSDADAARCSVVVVAAGAATGRPGVSRLDLLAENAVIVADVARRLRSNGFAGVLVVATNPVDVLAMLAQEVLELPAGRVIGTGTLVDTARLRGLLADEFEVEPRAVDAYIIGEHGDSEIAVWSGARIAGVPLDRFPGARPRQAYGEMLNRVRKAAPEIVERKGHTEYAIALCVQRICEAVLRNERAALAVSTLLQGEYGLRDVYLGTPCIVGKNGIERTIELPLDADERAGLHASARTLQQLYRGLEKERGSLGRPS